MTILIEIINGEQRHGGARHASLPRASLLIRTITDDIEH